MSDTPTPSTTAREIKQLLGLDPASGEQVGTILGNEIRMTNAAARRLLNLAQKGASWPLKGASA